MKIAITAQGPTPDSPVDQRFGRAYWLLFYDEAGHSWDAMENSSARNAVQGAGIQAAKAVADRQAAVLITGVTGPKAFQALEVAGVKIMHGATGSVAEALRAYQDGKLVEASAEMATGGP